MKRRAAALAVLLGALARPLAADPGDPKPAEALEMAADHLELDAEAHTAVLTGHVKLTRGAVSVACPRVDVRYDRASHVTWLKASGGVVAEIKPAGRDGKPAAAGVRAEAPGAELDLPSQTLELQGGVRMTQGDGWLEAERATVHVATGKVSMTGVKGSLPVPRPSGAVADDPLSVRR